MLCPVCRQPLVIVEYRDIELDACPDCRGLWFDAQELGQLFELAGADERFREFETQLERLPRAVPRRTCPRCDGKLVPVRAPSVSGDLILDQCPRSHGIWFDQGELGTLLADSLDPSENGLEDVRAFLGQFAAPASASEDQAR